MIPLREALSRLAATGFIESQEQKGFRVARLKAQEFQDITQSRILIECEALRLSISHADIDWESRLIATHHRLQRQPMLSDAGTLNINWELAQQAFHTALLSNCRSLWLLRYAQQLREQTGRYRALSLHGINTTERDVAAEHQALMVAALALQTEHACQLLSAHYQRTAEQVMSHPLFNSAEG